MRVLTTRTCGRLGNVFVEHVCLRVEPVTEEEPCEDLDFDRDFGRPDKVVVRVCIIFSSNGGVGVLGRER